MTDLGIWSRPSKPLRFNPENVVWAVEEAVHILKLERIRAYGSFGHLALT